MKRKLCPPKPSIVAKNRGSLRSDINHLILCIASGVSAMTSRNVPFRLREIPIRRWFQRMPRIGKLHCARNKENRHSVANKVPISIFRIKRDPPPVYHAADQVIPCFPPLLGIA